MAAVQQKTKNFSVKAYRGDFKTLLAFDFDSADGAKDLAGFTIQCQPAKGESYYLFNKLQFKDPGDHAMVEALPATASINAPFQKFRWVHVPGQVHQGIDPSIGDYTYAVTPRFFAADGTMTALDKTLSAAVTLPVGPFVKGNLAIGFTRGFTQSQAFVSHFGKDARIRPAGKALFYDTSAQSGSNAAGDTFTYAQQYDWLGFTARQRVLEVIEEVTSSPGKRLDVFAYDFNEPDIVAKLGELAAQGRLRLILDNSSLHHDSTANAEPEDQAEAFIRDKGGDGAVKRGRFARYSHDKVFIVRDSDKPTKVLTGSTNFSVTGLYVNSNHVLVFDDPQVAGWYADVFQASWDGNVAKAAFEKTDWSKSTYATTAANTPKASITFSPHADAFAETLLGGLVDRIAAEGKKTGGRPGSVLFAVMQINTEKNPVYDALNALHVAQSIYSYGISDSPRGIYLHQLGKKDGVLVTGKPGHPDLPPPFSQVPGVGSGHQVHHKFVVCGFNDDDAVVYCGSSNLAVGGEEDNGDNLLAIRDGDVAAVFAIEALLLVDHFDFLDRYATTGAGKVDLPTVGASQQAAAAKAGMFLYENGDWARKYFDSGDLHCEDRQLFG
ncbi:MAG: phospholipase D-like domain-containing protein [Devosia sp.]|nr:phospholipase D-like domain-containing protein [Devosia sp.]